MTIDTDRHATLSAADLDSLDIHSIEKYMAEASPWAEWDLLRREAPVFWYDRPGIEPFWAITRFDDVQMVGRDARRFLNGGGRLRRATAEHDARYGWAPDEPIDMVFMDDPRHQGFRSLVNRAFTPARCRRMAEMLD